MNKYYVLISVFMSAAAIIVPVSYANTECRPHYKHFDENTLMGILNMLDKAKTSSKETVVNNGHAMVARKTGECTVGLELYHDTSESQLLCRESIPVCLSEENKSTTSEEAIAARTHFENEKIKAKKYLDTLEADGKEQMKEKERRVQEHLKAHPQVETSEDYYVNNNGDHELMVTFIDNADEKSIENDMEKENAYFISTMERKDAITKLISVTTSNSKKLFDRLKKNPNVKSIEFNKVVKYDSYVVPAPNDPLYYSSCCGALDVSFSPTAAS